MQDNDGLNDHREDKTVTLAEQYADAHLINLVEQGRLQQIFGRTQINVNSLHSQGINRVGDGLTIEATALDGLVEAVTIDSMDFGVAVQWHPEWQVNKNPLQKQLFEAFGDACRARQSK